MQEEVLIGHVLEIVYVLLRVTEKQTKIASKLHKNHTMEAKLRDDGCVDDFFSFLKITFFHCRHALKKAVK